MFLRIIDKETKLFLRDGVEAEHENEEVINAPIVKGFHKPMWNGDSWEEGATQEYIDSLKAQAEPQEPSVEEKNRADVDYLAVMTGVEL